MSYLYNRDLTLTNNSSESQSESTYGSFLDLANTYHVKTFENGCLSQKRSIVVTGLTFQINPISIFAED